MFLKIAGSFLVIPSTSYIQKLRNRWLCLLELKLTKNLVFPYKTAGFFIMLIAIIPVANIWRYPDLSLVYQTRQK